MVLEPSWGKAPPGRKISSEPAKFPLVFNAGEPQRGRACLIIRGASGETKFFAGAVKSPLEEICLPCEFDAGTGVGVGSDVGLGSGVGVSAGVSVD
jgi:hypothetical protein